MNEKRFIIMQDDFLVQQTQIAKYLVNRAFHEVRKYEMELIVNLQEYLNKILYEHFQIIKEICSVQAFNRKIFLSNQSVNKNPTMMNFKFKTGFCRVLRLVDNDV